MNVIKEEPKVCTPVVLAGDIVQYTCGNSPCTPCIATSISVNGKKGINGISLDGISWLSNPQEAVDAGHAVLYKADEWELVLRKKSRK